MSFELIRQVWQLKLTATQQHVLMGLADYADDDGCNCYPSHKRLAWKLGCSIKTVARTIPELIGFGVVEVVRPATNKLPPRYRICLEKGTLKTPYCGDDGDSRVDNLTTQDNSRVDNLTTQDDLGRQIDYSRVDNLSARVDKMSTDPIINQSYNQAGNENGPFPEKAKEKRLPEKSAETDRQWGEQVQELGTHHKTMGVWLQGSELLPTKQTRDGLPVCQVLVVDPRSVDWLKSQGQRAIIKRLRHIFGVPVAIDIVAEFNEELRQLTTHKGAIHPLQEAQP